MEDVMIKINDTSEKVAGASRELSYEISNVVEGKEDDDNNLRELKEKVRKVLSGVGSQTASTQEMSASITELSESLNQVSDNANETLNLSKETATFARAGRESVEENIQGMKSVSNTVKKIEDKSIALGKSSEEIGNIVEMITKIANQTNMLSLNAAIEAARAGEAGKGFAVVSEEVRKLADSSNKAALEIENLLRVIQAEINEVIETIKVSYEEVEKGVKISENAKEKIVGIVEKVESTNNEVGRISTAIKEQATAVNEIDVATESIANQSEIIGDLAEEQSDSFDNIANTLNSVLSFSAGLSEVSDALKNMVGAFKIDTKKIVAIRDLIKWSKTYALGITKFDDEHKVLIALINQLNAAMLDGKGKKVLGKILDELANYTVTHFRHEEDEMQKYNYKGFKEHKRIHDTFVAKVLEVKQNMESGKAMVSIELLDFLKDWLIDHIIGVDQKGYAKAFKEMGVVDKIK
jgi:hemerythrin-like metal-binding protein